MTPHPEHLNLRAQLHAAADPSRRPPVNYLGEGSDEVLGVPVPVRRSIASAWARAQGRNDSAGVLAVVESLFDGPTLEEKTLGPLILGCHRAARAAVRPDDVDRWLGKLTGWSEIDHLCQGLFPAAQLLADWPAWREALDAWPEADSAAHRRASLVLLTGPVRTDPDPRLAAQAFATLERLCRETDPLISKAVSWLLRSLAARHADAVSGWLEPHASVVPSFVAREVRAKLATGRKSGLPSPESSAS